MRRGAQVGIVVSVAAFALLSTERVRADPISVPAALKCEFESYASGLADERASRISAEVKHEPGIDTLIYSAIDPGRDSAQLVGNAGASTVTFIGNGLTWSFIEVTDAGNVNVTQAFIWNEPDASQHLYRAVHSRHSSFAGRIVVSQHYGHCKALY